MIEINLLPGGLASKDSVAKILKVIATIDIVGTIVFGVCLFVLGGVLIVNTQNLNTSKENIESQKTKIKSMQNSEQQYYWVKERVDSIGGIMTKTKTFKNTEDLKSILSSMINLGNIVQLDIQAEKTDVTVGFDSSLKMKEFFLKLGEMNYSKIALDSLSFNPNTGYQAVLVLTK
jgi:hypothetical protein